MTRLTLEWHLRGIVEGTTDDECIRQELEWCDILDRWDRTAKRYYKAGSYTTGFTQESGDFCDVFDVPASKALRSEDPVKFLDAVANDPIRTVQERFDAARLLDYHIWPESPQRATGVLNTERDGIDVSEWTEAGMVRRSVGPSYLPLRCANPECMEGECLADPDTLRDDGKAVCMVCGTDQPEPQYP